MITNRAALLVSASLLGGCLELADPDVGPPLQERCVDLDSDPDTDVHFRDDVLDGLFRRADLHCDRCHTPGGATPIGLAVGGLDLSGYATLRAGGVVSGGEIVVPGQPCESLLVQKLADGPPFGGRMPLDGPAVSDLDQQLVRDWIAEGAHDN